jgi:hypothetical protein
MNDSMKQIAEVGVDDHGGRVNGRCAGSAGENIDDNVTTVKPADI